MYLVVRFYHVLLHKYSLLQIHFETNMANFINFNLPLFSLARMGHSLVTCDDSTFFMFGGYSLGHAALNDLWKFDVETETWTQLLPATNDEPGPRYSFFVFSLKI